MGWKPAKILQMNGEAVAGELPAEHQIITEAWNAETFHQVAAMPGMIYMPERKELLMHAAVDFPHRLAVMRSRDFGATWTEPCVISNGGGGGALTYLGKGKIVSGQNFSCDYGETWEGPVLSWPNQWDPYLVDKDPATSEVKRLAAHSYPYVNGGDTLADGMAPTSHQYVILQYSFDEGRTWGEGVQVPQGWGDGIQVPQWYGASEVALFRAKNNDIVAACRTDRPQKYRKPGPDAFLDHYEGLGVSLSRDNGYTWTKIKVLYDYGRMHPSMALMPNNDIVMTYVVRLGYPRDANGFSQFGIEAIISRDNGENWDLPHRFILARWSGNRKGREHPECWAAPQSTSTVLLPDGSLLTAYGTGYRSQPTPTHFAPRDVGLVHWQATLN